MNDGRYGSHQVLLSVSRLLTARPMKSPASQGFLPQQEFVGESHPRNPTTFKGRMRKEQEDLVLAADNLKGMRTTILRPPDFYGTVKEFARPSTQCEPALSQQGSEQPSLLHRRRDFQPA